MSENKIINNQEELDCINLDFTGEIIVVGGTINIPIVLSENYKNATVILSGNAVVIMMENSSVSEMSGNSFVSEMWENSSVSEMRENSSVSEMRENSSVSHMRENSSVSYMWENSSVSYMWENSSVSHMMENSSVSYMSGNSSVSEMRGNSSVSHMRENSSVSEMRENSSVSEMRGNSSVSEMWGNSTSRVCGENNKINCYGYNYVFVDKSITDINNIKLNDTSQILLFDTFRTNQSLDFYLKNYDVKKKDENTLIMYKAVHKSVVEDEYFSDYDKNFIYKLGETKEHICSSDTEKSCSIGLHVSDLFFAKRFGLGWEDLAIIEVEVPIEKIVISKECDGKIRTSELTVVRELDKSEYCKSN